MKKFTLVAAVAALLASVAGDAVAKDPRWICMGPVDDCRSNQKAGKFGCAHVVGGGDTRGMAEADALGNCAAELEHQHGGSFACVDASQLTCAGDAPKARPEAAKSWTCNGELTCEKAGERQPCSVTTYENALTEPQAESSARPKMLTHCATRWGVEESACDFDSLSCSPTY